MQSPAIPPATGATGGPITRAAMRRLRAMVEVLPDDPQMGDLEEVLRLLAKWRSQVLAQTQIGTSGAVVQGGLFAGMTYSTGASEGSLMARLVGSYEAALAPHIEQLVADGVDCVIDIGCAEGYYAVGLARRYPHLTVYAHDISEAARAACAALASENGVEARVHIGGEFKPADFESFAGRNVLVMVDAEGAEIDVLLPEQSPSLAKMKLIVETHDVWRPGARAELQRRFAPTHDIRLVEQTHAAELRPPWLTGFSELDLLLAVWEWRHRLTPWLVMTPHAVD